MLGMIGIEKLRISCVIGANPDERDREQDIFVDLKVEADFQTCLGHDRISSTISYVDLAEVCTRVAQKGKYHLLETYAAEVLSTLFAQFEIKSAWVKVIKPEAIPKAEAAYVELKTCLKSSDRRF